MNLEQIDMRIAQVKILQVKMGIAYTDEIIFALDNMLGDLRTQRSELWERFQPKKLIGGD